MKNLFSKTKWVTLIFVFLAVISSTAYSVTQLEVPYYTQDGSGWCWATSLSMVLKYYGFEKKPWEIAAASDFNKGFDVGPNLFGEGDIQAYLEDHFNGGYSDAWNFIMFWNWQNSDIKNSIYNVISTGHPFYLNIHYADPSTNEQVAHAIVVTGCTGISDDDFIIFHDPSGGFTGNADDVVYSKLTWNTFFDKLDFTFWFIKVYGIYARPNKLTPDPDLKPLSVEVEPNKLYFKKSQQGSSYILNMRWDGIEPYDGYRYEGNSEVYFPDDDDDIYKYDYKAVQSSVLHVKPTYSIYSLASNNIIFRYRYCVYKVSDSSLIKSWLSPVSPVINQPKTGTLNIDNDHDNKDDHDYVLPMNELPEGVYKLEVAITDESVTQIYDKCSFVFGVVWEGEPLEISPTRGPNGLISPNSNFEVLPYQKVTFTATHDTGYQVDKWYVNGNELTDFEGEESIDLEVTEDIIVLVTFKPDNIIPSEIEVAGSASPNTLETSIAPGNGKWFDIPVYNTGASAVTVNCTKSGEGANWTTLEMSSFTLSGYETKKNRVTINVPDNAPGGTYQVNINFNNIIFPISIRVAATGDVFSEILQPSTGYINGNNSNAYYDFNRDGYEYFDISGKYQTFAQTYCNLSENQYINAGNYDLIVVVKNLAATGNQNLIIKMNNNVIGTIDTSQAPINSNTAFTLNGRWSTLSTSNVITFGLASYSSSDETLRWRIYDTIRIGTKSTSSAWAANDSVIIPDNIWNSIQDGYMETARVYANVTQVSDSGTLYLFNNGKEVDSISIDSSDPGHRKYWTLLRSELDEENYFVVKGSTSDIPVVNLSNFAMEVTFNNNEPVLEITKQISSRQIQVGQQAIVTVRIENTRSGSTTGYDTDLTDSLPTGLRLIGGDLNKNNIDNLKYQDTYVNSYTITADQAGRYVLPSAQVDYETIEGVEMVDESSPLELVVMFGQLTTESNIKYPQIINTDGAYFSAVVKAPDGITLTQDASVYGIIQKNNGGNWETIMTVPMGWSQSDNLYTGISSAISSDGDYRAYVIAQKNLYIEGQSAIKEFSVIYLTPDLNADDKINFFDFSIFADQWMLQKLSFDLYQDDEGMLQNWIGLDLLITNIPKRQIINFYFLKRNVFQKRRGISPYDIRIAGLIKVIPHCTILNYIPLKTVFLAANGKGQNFIKLANYLCQVFLRYHFLDLILAKSQITVMRQQILIMMCQPRHNIALTLPQEQKLQAVNFVLRNLLLIQITC